MLEVLIAIQAFPVTTPLFESRVELLLQRLHALWRDPFHGARNDDGCEPDLYMSAYGFEVTIGQHHATIARLRWTAEGVRRCAVQPDAAAATAFASIPLIGIIDRKGADTIEVRELFARHGLTSSFWNPE